VVHSCSTETIANVVREYEGVRRKHSIGEMVRALKIDAPHVVASFGEDAAVIEHNGEALLLAADGIWSGRDIVQCSSIYMTSRQWVVIP
jgi:selenophosphate synthetase-related protein